MGEKTDIHAVELVRGIRDSHAELLRGKSNDQIIEFYRSAAEAFRKTARAKTWTTASKEIQRSA